MNDRELDRLVARVNPYGDRTVANLPTDGAEADLLEELMASAPSTRMPTDDPGRPLLRTTDMGRPPRRSRRWAVPVAAAAATALIALAGLVAVPRLAGPDTLPADPAGDTAAVATANEWLLLDAPGWTIDNVAETRTDRAEAEVTYTNGARLFSIHWRTAQSYDVYYQDRANDGTVTKADILGRAGTVFRYRYPSPEDSKTDMGAMLPPKGPTFLEIRADLGSEQAFRAMLGKLRPVDFTTWLAALPPSVVKPDQNAAVAAQMLADVPLPTGFDRDRLNDGIVASRYNFGARVVGTVACGWMDQWGAATTAADPEGARKALAALQSSKSWKIVQELGTRGAYPVVLRDAIDEIAAGKVEPGPATGPAVVPAGPRPSSAPGVDAPKQRTIGDLKQGLCQ